MVYLPYKNPMNVLQRTVIVTVIASMAANLSAATAERSREELPKPNSIGQLHHPHDPHPALEPGWRAYQRGDVAEALRIYQEVAVTSPDDAGLWYDLGCLYALNHEGVGARRALQRALRLKPRFPEAFDALGQLHEQAGDIMVAHALYASADTLRSGDAKFLRHLVRTFLTLKETDAARNALQHLLMVEPNDTEARYQLGVLELRANAPDLAAKEFRDVVERKPDYALAWNGLALAYARIGAFGEASEAINKAKALNPTSAATETNLGIIAAYQQRWDEARSAWEQALKLDPQFVPAAKNLEALPASSTTP